MFLFLCYNFLMEKVLYIIIVFILLIMIASIIYCYINIDVENFNINDKRIDKDIKILFLSDLHNRRIFNTCI